MLTRTSIVTGLAVLLLSTTAFADSTPSTSTMKPKPTQNTQKLADRCSALETQFDQAITTHGNAAKAAAATLAISPRRVRSLIIVSPRPLFGGIRLSFRGHDKARPAPTWAVLPRTTSR